MRAPLLLVSIAAGAVALYLASCSSNDVTPPAVDAGGDAADDVVDAAATPFCTTATLPTVPFSAGPYGTHRGEVAEDFSVPLVGGSTWSFKGSYSGCEVTVVVPDGISISAADSTSVWTKDKDLASLVTASPRNVRYLFVSTQSAAGAAQATEQAMQDRIDALLATLPEVDAAHWRERLLVASVRSADLGNWVYTVLNKYGYAGLAIDRTQRIQGLGSLADIKRYSSKLQAQNMWPYENNLAYAANEALYLNAQYDRQSKLDAAQTKVVKLWNGEILSEFAETDATLPTAQEMAGYDTLQVEVTMACPKPGSDELGNCGAWDYIARLQLREGDDGGANLEIARFITSYHRETHWIVDATPWLARMQAGGLRHFRWDFAPSWNKQPTATTLALHFSNAKKGYAPSQVVPLFTGGPFDSNYDVGRVPVDVPIPADAKRVELLTLVTGHGAGTNQCSEFCNHQHELTLAGKAHLKDFPAVGKNDGCIAEQERGMVPNQSGTWWLGRGGWCPGQQVEPWTVDVTADAKPGTTATVSYRGLYANATPPDGAGNIDLASYLVISK
jgi:hypothetical protein